MGHSLMFTLTHLTLFWTWSTVHQFTLPCISMLTEVLDTAICGPTKNNRHLCPCLSERTQRKIKKSPPWVCMCAHAPAHWSAQAHTRACSWLCQCLPVGACQNYAFSACWRLASSAYKYVLDKPLFDLISHYPSRPIFDPLGCWVLCWVMCDSL